MEDSNLIISAVDRFIDSRMYHYALLINGQWGSGKTFFVQNELIPHIKETDKDVNYISLYGVKSVDEISWMLCIEAIKDKMGKAGSFINTKGGRITAAILSAAAKFGISKSGIESKSIEDIISTIPNYNNNIIIFDDLERCICDINEILGFVNYFVEHSDAAVILVANEEEIGKWQLSINPELQMMTAMNPYIDLETRPTEKEALERLLAESGKKPIPEKNSFTLEQVEERREKIFHHNDNYFRVKEKIVGQTINYTPDLKNVFTALIKKHIKSHELNDTLNSMVDDLVNIAEKEGYYNLRSFQLFLEKITIVFDCLEQEHQDLYQTIILYTYRSSMKYTKGEKMPEWDGDYGYQQANNKLLFSEQIFGFRFIDELIFTNSINKEGVQQVLSQYLRVKKEKGELTNDPYQHVKKWRLASDEELSSWLNDIEVNIRDGKYSTELYPDIIRLIVSLSVENIMVDQCNNLIAAMRDYICNTEPAILKELEPESFPLQGENGRKYKEIQTEISDLIAVAKKQSEKLSFENYIKKEDWATNIYNLAADSEHKNNHSFIYWLDTRVLVEKIAASSNKELNMFRYAMGIYYDGYDSTRFLLEDAEKLKELDNLIKDIDLSDWGQIQKSYHKHIIEDIEKYIQKADLIEKDDNE